ncbi:MAG: tRNA (adenosine(37)-N6)-threonylcarbamoyltransferase complex dimerization subunit type 1 TsaB [Bacteroidetes bacterium GWF2_40_14]|nr:MAG: tRNA (adenosine(37)-N6)-threonylcarbamoyltransferase complex dimerization subunit type 1 TsaB [Bacteroidetes bacterium GWF2_40_14]
MSNPNLLLIETSTEVCSVALSAGERIISYRVIKEAKSHARVIALLINEVLEEGGLTIDRCDAVVVSEGPGSYTGLRVGVSIAKGLCYGANKPLIAVSSLELLGRLTTRERDVLPGSVIIAMIDARRMEVYAAKFDSSCNPLSAVEAVILDESSFSAELSKGPVIFSGDGARKFMSMVNNPNANFSLIDADARGMVASALKKYFAGDFVDVAYFEPYYLKDFVAGVTKKIL